ncbi:unnamed protein product [Amoebophrya sp. A25]|nr:unnamed protein product [Amoebophrya sp. A25]|eukprot:GSA25T00011721001.1
MSSTTSGVISRRNAPARGAVSTSIGGTQVETPEVPTSFGLGRGASSPRRSGSASKQRRSCCAPAPEMKAKMMAMARDSATEVVHSAKVCGCGIVDFLSEGADDFALRTLHGVISSSVEHGKHRFRLLLLHILLLPLCILLFQPARDAASLLRGTTAGDQVQEVTEAAAAATRSNNEKPDTRR